MNGRIGREEDRTNVRTAADNITDLLDEQALKNFEMNLQVNRYKSELRHALQQLDEHTYCPGDVDIMIQVYKQEIERLMEENILLKMHLAQKEKEAKEAKENENEKK